MNRSANHHRFAPTALAVAISLCAADLHAADLPTGGNIVGGSGSISQDGNSLNVQQNSDKLITDWNSFDIGAGNTVNFYQPGKDSVALNRVIGEDASAIYGNLNANGKVFLVNPNGVLFGKGAAVNVGALVASTLSLSNEDFNDGNYQFQGDGSNAAVINHGRINADQGAVALLGGQVSNHGIIQANQGSVALAAGDKITLDFAGDGLLNVTVDEGTVDALVENHQLIRANGGQVVMTANATNALLQTVVNNTGIIEAQTLENQSGTIVLKGGFNGGTVNVAGTLDASAPDSGDGGFIDTSGANVKVAGGTHVTTQANNGTTGEWLIDPTDFYITAGSDPSTDSGIGADTLSDSLSRNNVTLETPDTGSDAGDLYVNGAVSWDANTTLSLNAHNDIHINEAITGANGGLTLNAGGEISASGAVDVGTFYLQSGDWTQLGSSLPTFYANDFQLDVSNASFLRALGGNGTETNPYQLTDIFGVQGFASHTLLNSHLVLANDIDASGTMNWNAGAGYLPIGNSGANANYFTGSLDGQGHVINGLTIYRPYSSYIGLFGATSNSTISNIGLTNVSINGGSYVGGLIGYGYNGGMAGSLLGNISNSYVTGTVTGRYTRVAGLAGHFSGTISGSYFTGTLAGTAGEYKGGLVGSLTGHLINSYATADVAGDGNFVGGLVGGMTGSISNSFATGNVSSSGNNIGGLAGRIYGAVTDSYATGSVSGLSNVGGLLGSSYYASTNSSYATGTVTGTSNAGALVGYNQSSFNNSYWNTETSGVGSAAGNGTSVGATGLTTAQMFDASNLVGLDFDNVWNNADDQTTPYLRGLANNRVFNKNDLPSDVIDSVNRPALYTVIQDVDQLQAMQNNLAGRYVLGNNIDASATVDWNDGEGFAPIGGYVSAFTGVLDGLSHAISGLTINRSNISYVGLIGSVATGSILRNIGLYNANVSGYEGVGILAGNNSGLITNAYAMGTVTGYGAVGGIAGTNLFGAINNVYSDAVVSGSQRVGGLVGLNEQGYISYAYANGSVSGSTSGALIGTGIDGTQENLYWNQDNASTAFGNAGTSGDATGLSAEQMTSADSFSGWDIDSEGGTGSIWRIYEGYTAPLLRSFLTTLTIDAGDSTSTYNGTEQTGNWTASEEYDASQIFGQVAGGTNAGNYNIDLSGLYSGQLGYDLITSNGTLTINKANATVRANSGTTTYNGSEQSISGFTVEGLVNGEDASVLTDVTTSGGSGRNAGEYTHSASGSDSNYELTFVDGSLTIERKVITGNITANDKTYDGSTYADTQGVLDGMIDGDDLQFDTEGAFADKNAGDSKQVDVSGSLSGGDADNYELSTNDTTTADIDRKAITGNITADGKTYDGTRDAVTGGTLDGVIAGDDIEFDTEGSFADKNAGDDKQVDVSGSLSGTDAGNYVLTTNDTTTADIDRKVITADIQARDKLFDGSLQAILEGMLNGTISGDDVELQMRGVFASLKLGENSVRVDASLRGADAGNYELVAPESVVANVQGFVQNAAYQSAIVSQPPQPRKLAPPATAEYTLEVDGNALNLSP
ncbi:MAG: YDG domain-containing protein [Pseudomonadaceae bacterium]